MQTVQTIMAMPDFSERIRIQDLTPAAQELCHLPLVLQISRDFTRHDSFEEIANSLKFEALRVHTLQELFPFLLCGSRDPALIVLDHDSILQTNDVGVLINSIRMIVQFKDPNARQLRFAALVTAPLDRTTVKTLKNQGILGLVPQDTGAGNFNFYLNLKAYEELLHGNEYWPTECVKKNSEPRRGRSEDACGIHLTERQQQVQKLLCERGLSNKAIARHLNISEGTVKIHVSAILKRYAVRNRTQLALAVKNHSRL